MSTLPSQTRSLRKPAGDISSRNEKAAALNRAALASNSTVSNTVPRASRSPSRLPVKPPTRIISRPPSATGSVTSKTSSIHPPARNVISKPTIGGLQRSTSTRTRSSSTTNTSFTEPVKTDRSRPPLTQSRHLRNASTSSTPASYVPSHTRAKSSSTVLNPSTTLRPPSREPVRPPKRDRPPTRESALEQATLPNPQLKRPAFSTLQQHFSPNKNLAPKPHPAAFLAPPSPSKLPSNIAISADTAKLQNELLQLHLLHRDAAQVSLEWRASARRKLGARFQDVVDRNEELAALESEKMGMVNAVALQKWRDTGSPGWRLEEKVQVLGDAISGIWNLGDAGGKYARVVRRFERWFVRCQDILSSRDREDEGEEIVFLEELDAGWKDDCLVIGRKLESWRDDLRHLGEPDPASSLAAVVEGCRGLVKDMLMELGIMAQIEKDAMATELDWIRSMNDDGLDDGDIPVAGAVWRSR